MPKLAVLAVLFLLCAVSAPAQDDIRSIEARVIQLLNDYRIRKGKPALQLNETLSAQSLQHSKDMASGRVPFGHDGFDDRSERVKAVVPRMDHIAENVAYGDLDADRVVKLWLNSPGHRKNIEGKFNYTGIGTVRNRQGQLYFTMMFLHQ